MHSVSAREGGNTVCWKAMVRSRTVDDSMTYWFPWKHPMAGWQGLKFGILDQTPRKWACRLGPSGLAIRLFQRLCTKTQPKCGLGPRDSPFHRRKCTKRQFFAASASVSRSRACCVRLRPRWVFCLYWFGNSSGERMCTVTKIFHDFCFFWSGDKCHYHE